MNSNNEQSLEEQGFWTLSGKKPFFGVILAPTHLEPAYRLNIPAKMVSALPSVTIPVVLIYQGKEWKMNYIGKNNRFDRDWRIYADDNNLKVGDGSIFELKEFDPKKLVFRTQILRGDTPPEIMQKLVPDCERVFKYRQVQRLEARRRCHFELVDCSSTKLVLRVPILSGKIPPELLEKCKPRNRRF